MADQPENKPATEHSHETGAIAKWVLAVSGFAITAASIAALVGGAKGGRYYETSQTVFNALLPLAGTWVGTVLAYYFARQNFESASQSVERMVNMTTEQRLGQLNVEKEMMRPSQIKTLVIPAGKTDADILITEMRDMLVNQKISRIPIADSAGVVKYIVHSSGLYKFIAESAVAGKDIKTLTLADLVVDANLKDWVVNIAYVSDRATVAQAKALMEAQPGCQDLIVTRTGAKNEPLLGWMTNVDIGRLSKA
jgi:hypothetical protein